MSLRPDQILDLEDVQAKLLDTFLAEADPAQWPPAPEKAKERFWHKRNAALTMTLVTKISHMLNFVRGRQPLTPDPAEGEGAEEEALTGAVTEKEIRAAHREAKQLLKSYGKNKGSKEG